MDIIESNKNCITTECGHCFHANCLMKNVAHNGFDCPYCRTSMAQEVEDKYSVDSDDSDYSDWERHEDEENALTSFRMFNQRINGEEVEENPDDDDDDDESTEDESTERNNVRLPDASYIAQKLVERGITFEDLVKDILYQGSTSIINYTNYTNYEERSNVVYGQFRAIISRYNPAQVEVPQVEVPQVEVPQVEVPQVEVEVAVPQVAVKKMVEVDYESQPKISVKQYC
jgi:hypothetical protein